MAHFIKHNLFENDFILHSNRVIFWEQEKILILSDLHFGKITHFRKAGIALPNEVMKEDFQRLFEVIQFFKPVQIIIVGDLFHSVANNEHDMLLRWRNDLPHIAFTLVKGNHDIVPKKWYTEANISIVDKILKLGKFIFVHQLEDYTEVLADGEYLICGHIHPAILVRGLAKQSLRFPCFYFTKNYLILPAFGKFTGTFLIEPEKHEQTFAIVNKDIIKM
jgi:uncharacterized protein